MQTDITIQRLAYNVPDACKVLSTSRQTLYDLINQGRLRSFTEGRRRYISRQAIDDYIAAQEQQRGNVA
ncbi:MAG TPA: helix-turn-helix domain-containing protein [Candidatus Competibacter sp.]|nr:helix-turn-helix domain-containing protein [Candidatus Competibacter sp.]HRW66109.1 helix-turn-helix domain-containing protein [Candidatus Competibacter sp.]